MTEHDEIAEHYAIYPFLLVFVTDRFGDSQYSYLFEGMTVRDAGRGAEALYHHQTGFAGTYDSVYVSDTPISGANESAGLEIQL